MLRFLSGLILVLPLVAVLSVSGQVPGPDPRSGSFGFSSDDQPGGTSYLGVDTRDITPDRVSALKLKDESGVEVTMVDQDAPAGKAGIQEGDVILTINGNKVESVEQLRRMIREIPPGRVTNVGISRDGRPMNFQVKLATRERFMSMDTVKAYKFKMPEIPPIPPIDIESPVSVVVVHSSLRSGLVVENLTRQLGEFFGAKDGQGVLVRSVERGSQADKAGFRAGDVIVRVEKDAIHDTGDFRHAMRSHRSDKQVSVGIIRDKKEINVTLPLPENRDSGRLLLDEERFEVPDIDIDADMLEKLDVEVARLKPQITLAMREAQRSIEKASREFCKQQRNEMQKEMRRQQNEMQRHQKEMQQQLHDQTLEWQNEWNDQNREIQRELRELQHIYSEI
jgi:serine protease Do